MRILWGVNLTLVRNYEEEKFFKQVFNFFFAITTDSLTKQVRFTLPDFSKSFLSDCSCLVRNVWLK